jgi:hypothetical protein
MKRPLKLFWCSTPSGEEDYWVVAPSRAFAIAYFADENGFDVDVSAEEIGMVPESAWHEFNRALCTPHKNLLERWGVFYNENFHVFHYRGRIFRPEGLVRALMRSNAWTRRKLRLARMS